MIQVDITSRTKNPTLTPGVVRNSTPSPPKILRLLTTTTPAPQPCFNAHPKRKRSPVIYARACRRAAAKLLRTKKPGDCLKNNRNLSPPFFATKSQANRTRTARMQKKAEVASQQPATSMRETENRDTKVTKLCYKLTNSASLPSSS